MTRLHKIVVATALLLSGYGLALVASGLSDFLWARRLIDGGTAPHGDWNAAGEARLVPDSAAAPAITESAPVVAPPNSNAAVQRAPSPTWLSPVTQASWSGTANNERAKTPAAAEIVTVAAPAIFEPMAEAEAGQLDERPRARLTDVKRTDPTAFGQNTGGQSRPASPWDRWPRWDPPATFADPTPANGARTSVAAEFASEAVPPADSQVPRSSFDGLADYSSGEFAALRIHIVADGDSLAKLSDRYLDDPALGDTIYQLNRAVLTDPELLPIGTELRIPERRTARSPRAGLLPRDSLRPAANGPVDAGPFEEGRWLPASGAPRAQLLGPQPPTSPADTSRPAQASW